MSAVKLRPGRNNCVPTVFPYRAFSGFRFGQNCLKTVPNILFRDNNIIIHRL
jgi:hypothetical protein